MAKHDKHLSAFIHYLACWWPSLDDALHCLLTLTPQCSNVCFYVVGVSLSEPHTSVTPLCTYVCIIHNKFQMSTFNWCCQLSQAGVKHYCQTEAFWHEKTWSEGNSSWTYLQQAWKVICLCYKSVIDWWLHERHHGWQNAWWWSFFR